MSDTIVARAPGKLFLLGEYAVLDRCPAVVAAVDRHVEVRLQRGARGARVRINAPGCGAVEFAATESPPIAGPLRFVIAAFTAARARHPQVGRQGASLTITSALVGPRGAKIGLGSSAAVTAASVAAFLVSSGSAPDTDDVFAIALAAHHAAQAGVGSGADVAASTYGGTLLFQPRNGALPAVLPLTLPARTVLLAGWSGAPASTADLVQQYLGARNGCAAARAGFVGASRTHVDSFVNALQQGLLSYAAIDGSAASLERLGRDLDLQVMTPRLARLIAIARTHGAAAKISGAGGGDCGIALTRDAAAAQRIRRAWREAEIEPLDVALDTKGVTVVRCSETRKPVALRPEALAS